MVNQTSQDPNGVWHVTGTVSLRNVTATDGTDDYSVVGSSWYGGKGLDPSTATVIDTEEFNILNSQGGKVGSVHGEMTFYPDGSGKGFILGNCTPPALDGPVCSAEPYGRAAWPSVPALARPSTEPGVGIELLYRTYLR